MELLLSLRYILLTYQLLSTTTSPRDAFPVSLQHFSLFETQIETMGDKQMRECSVCSPPVYHQLHDNLNAMATESRGPLRRSHSGPYSKHSASHHIHARTCMYNHTHSVHNPRRSLRQTQLVWMLQGQNICFLQNELHGGFSPQ